MISVIVPAYNAQETLDACLSALERQALPPHEEVEIIVVDDGSTDDTAEVARCHSVRLIVQDNAGPAAARNAGARAARGELLLFTDADCIPAPEWVARMAGPFVDPSVAGAKGVYRSSQPELVARFVQLEYEDRYARMRGQERIDFVDTYSAAYRREVFWSAGGFDPSFAYLEDQELSFRLAGLGHRLVFVPDAIVYHRHADNLLWYARKKRVIGYWKALVMRRHPDKLVADSHTPQTLKLQMGLVGAGGLLLALGTLSRRSRLVVAGLGGWILFGLTTLPLVRKAGAKDSAVALLAPLLLFARAAALGMGFLQGSLRGPRLNPWPEGTDSTREAGPILAGRGISGQGSA